MRGLLIVLPLLVAGCADAALVRGFRERDEAVAQAFDGVADQVETQRMDDDAIAKATKAAVAGVREPEALKASLTEPTPASFRAIAAARREASNGTREGLMWLATSVALFGGGYLIGRRR